MLLEAAFNRVNSLYADNRVVATGKDAKTVWIMANRKNPAAVPTLVKIPKSETLILPPA